MSDFLHRFDRFIEKTPGGCWLWTGQRKPAGYGYVDVYENGDGSRTRLSAHREAVGAPRGVTVRHRCHNPPCVNPEHLLTGTQADNSADMVEAGRSTARIPLHLIEPIRVCIAAGVSGAFLARMAGVSPTTINRIGSGQTFRTIPGERSRDRNRGIGHRSSNLNEDIVREIRRRASSGERQAAVARAMGVTPQAVSLIVNRKSWRHVE